MKKGISIVLAVVLLLGLSTSAVADSSARPFKGRVADSIMTVVNISGDLNDLFSLYVTVRVDGTIIATHLGKGTIMEVVSVDYSTSYWDPYPILHHSLVPGEATFTFIAANGDELYGILEGDFWQNTETGDAGGTFYGTFTGGTGRFEGAEGTVVKEYTQHGEPFGSTAVIDSCWDGMIGY